MSWLWNVFLFFFTFRYIVGFRPKTSNRVCVSEMARIEWRMFALDLKKAILFSSYINLMFHCPGYVCTVCSCNHRGMPKCFPKKIMHGTWEMEKLWLENFLELLCVYEIIVVITKDNISLCMPWSHETYVISSQLHLFVIFWVFLIPTIFIEFLSVRHFEHGHFEFRHLNPRHFEHIRFEHTTF